MGSMKLASPELIIYTTAYMPVHLASEDLFMVGSLNTAVTAEQQPKKENQSQLPPKCFKTHLCKRGSFHSAPSFLVYLTVAGSSTEENNFTIKA